MILNYRLFILLIIISNTITPEFILYKKDAEKIAPLNYKNMSDNEKTELIELYEKTIIRYQWPTVLKYYSNFSHKEKQDYLHACSIKKGLSDFITKKVESLSKNKYSSAWIPTTIFELQTLSYCVKNMTEEIIKEKFTKLPNEKKGDFFEIFFIQEYLFNIFDELLNSYQKEGAFITTYSGNESVVAEFINKTVTNISNNKTFGQKFRIMYFSPEQLLQYKITWPNFSIYEGSWLTIIQKILQVEEVAYQNNQFLLLRGTNGYNTNQQDHIDYQLGSEIGISYGYSLFAGTVFERFYKVGDKNTISVAGARALDYIEHFKIGYYLSLSIKDFDNLRNIFSLPDLSTFESLFGAGEEFHPRLRRNIQKLPEQQKHQIAQQLSQYLQKAKFLKLEQINAQNQKILKQDIELQQEEILYGQGQGRFEITHAEELEFYNNIIIPLVESGKPLPAMITPYIKFFDTTILQKLTTQQLSSLTPEQLNSLDQMKLLKQLSPAQLQALINSDKFQSLPFNLFNDHIISKLKPEQIASLSLLQMNSFNKDQLESFRHHLRSFNHAEMTKLANPEFIKQLPSTFLAIFPISEFNQPQTQALRVQALQQAELHQINTQYLSKEQIKSLGINITLLYDFQIYNLSTDAIQALSINIFGLPMQEQELEDIKNKIAALRKDRDNLNKDFQKINDSHSEEDKEKINLKNEKTRNDIKELSKQIDSLEYYIENNERYVINCTDISKLSIEQIQKINADLALKMNSHDLSQLTLDQFQTILSSDKTVFNACIENQDKQVSFLLPDRICLLNDQQMARINKYFLMPEQINALQECNNEFNSAKKLPEIGDRTRSICDFEKQELQKINSTYLTKKMIFHLNACGKLGDVSFANGIQNKTLDAMLDKTEQNRYCPILKSIINNPKTILTNEQAHSIAIACNG